MSDITVEEQELKKTNKQRRQAIVEQLHYLTCPYQPKHRHLIKTHTCYIHTSCVHIGTLMTHMLWPIIKVGT